MNSMHVHTEHGLHTEQYVHSVHVYSVCVQHEAKHEYNSTLCIVLTAFSCMLKDYMPRGLAEAPRNCSGPC